MSTEQPGWPGEELPEFCPQGSFSTRPAKVRLEVGRYLWRDGLCRLLVIVSGVCLFLGLGWILERQWYVIGGIFTFLGVLVIRLLVKYLEARKLAFRGAALLGGIVISARPFRFLAFAQMGTGGEGLPRRAMKVFEGDKPPSEDAVEGRRIPCVATFRDGEDWNYWKDFLAQPLSLGCSDRKVLAERLAKIPAEEFADLEEIIRGNRVPEPRMLVWLDPPSPPRGLTVDAQSPDEEPL